MLLAKVWEVQAARHDHSSKYMCVIISNELISPGYGIDLSHFNLNHIQHKSEMEHKTII